MSANDFLKSSAEFSLLSSRGPTQHRCSYCRQEGHNIRTCPVLTEDLNEIERLRQEKLLREQNRYLLAEVDRLSESLARLRLSDRRYRVY